ncbi:MAG: peptide deformylase [Candidatus Shapirobacteria bacterium]|jgi:peptide deformylase
MSKILIYPNKILRQKAVDVDKIDDKLLKQIKDLKDLLEKGDNAAGLAAPQIGISRSFFGIKDSDKKVKVFINPKITKIFGDRVYPMIIREPALTKSAVTEAMADKEDFLEGCLSFPDYFGTVKRYLKIEVSWMEIKGKKFITKTKELEGFEAIVWQHESDHLVGKLFVDYVKKDGGKFYKWDGKEMVKWKIEKVI